jgi:hypothetical protein
VPFDLTLWCEKPMYIQLDFILRRWVEMARQYGWTIVSIKHDWKSVFE